MPNPYCYNLEQAIGSIGLNVNENKTKFIWIKKTKQRSISILSRKPRKLVDLFTWHRKNISSTVMSIYT